MLWPPARAAPADAGEDPNQRAIVAEADAGGVRRCSTADAESDVLGGLDLGPVDVLKVSHHGSADPGLPALLERLRPRLAAIEVGRRNTYGHPAAATVARARGRGRVASCAPTATAACASSRRPGRCASTRTPRLDRVPAFKPAYLIHGDDHGRIGERRARLRAMAEAESGAGGVEVFEGDASTPEAVALALSAMTFAMGRRFLIVDGVERWKDADVEATLAPALAAMPPDTTVGFFGREEGRVKAPAKLVAAVKKAGGDVAVEATLKAKELPRWAVGRGREARRQARRRRRRRALIAHVGERQQRLLRELEKLALEHGQGARIGVEEVEAAAAPSAERQVWGLVDALVAGDGARRDARLPRAARAGRDAAAPGAAHGPPRARRARDRRRASRPASRPRRSRTRCEGSPWAADRRIKEARATDAEALRRALEALADLELASRGQSELADDTEALRAIAAIAA